MEIDSADIVMKTTILVPFFFIIGLCQQNILREDYFVCELFSLPRLK